MLRLVKSALTATCCLATAAAAVSAPMCQSTAPGQRQLDVPSANATIPHPPFGVVYASNDLAFVANGNNVGVLNTSTFTPALIRQIPLPLNSSFGAAGVALTRDKRNLFVAAGPGAAVIDVEKAASGAADPVVGVLESPVGDTAIEVTLSADDQWAFVSQEDGNEETNGNGFVEVFGVQRAPNGSVSGTYIGYVELGFLVVGSALSADGSLLYVTSETTTPNTTHGTLSVLDVETLKTDPSQALVASADAGCGAVRIAVSPCGGQVWVTARESNRLLAFDAAKLRASRPDALLASVQVGTSPVGLAFFHNGSQMVVADSNRFKFTNTTSGLSVIDTAAALRDGQSFPQIPSGIFPRELAVSPDGTTLLASVYGSNETQTVDLTGLGKLH